MPAKKPQDRCEHPADSLAGVPLHLLVGLVVVHQRPDAERDDEQQHLQAGAAHLSDGAAGLRVPGGRRDAGQLPVAVLLGVLAVLRIRVLLPASGSPLVRRRLVRWRAHGPAS
jgi:hypothetical protein